MNDNISKPICNSDGNKSNESKKLRIIKKIHNRK